MTVVQLLLLLSGDVELNPGPPKRAPVKAPPKKEETPPPPVDMSANFGALESKVTETVIGPPKVGKKTLNKNHLASIAYKAFWLYKICMLFPLSKYRFENY